MTEDAGPLGRDRIVAAALGIVDTGGVEALSMRRLARALGTAPMSLYRHVRDKDELLELVVDALASRLPLPPDDAPWEETIAESLRAMRRILLDHPGMVSFVTHRALFTSSVLDTLERMLTALRQAGLSEREAARCYSTLWSLTLGSVLLEQSVVQSFADSTDAEEERRRVAAAAAAAAGDSHPTVAAAARHWVDMDRDEAFEEGLATLLAGIRQRAARSLHSSG